MQPTSLPALISLPRLADDTALLLAALIALLTVVVGGRAALAWQGLTGRATGAQRRRARLEQLEVAMPTRFDVLRDQLRALNAGTERALWWLPRVDERLDDTRAALAAGRPRLEALARDDGRAMRATFARIRGTLNVLRSARDLRRTILG